MKKILIVEDEFIISLTTQNSIRKLGHQVVGAVSTGAEAIEAVRQTQPDLILMDISLVGGPDGIETMKEIQRFSDVPVVYLSGNSDPRTKTRAAETNMAGFLVKPLDDRSFRSTLSGILSAQQA